MKEKSQNKSIHQEHILKGILFGLALLVVSWFFYFGYLQEINKKKEQEYAAKYLRTHLEAIANHVMFFRLAAYHNYSGLNAEYLAGVLGGYGIRSNLVNKEGFSIDPAGESFAITLAGGDRDFCEIVSIVARQHKVSLEGADSGKWHHRNSTHIKEIRECDKNGTS